MIKAINFLTIFLLIFTHQVQAQSNLWDELVTKPFLPTNNIPEKNSNTADILKKNIKRQQQEVFTLRIEGKSESEIIKILNARLKVLGTGSISGTVFKNDGITPLDELIMVDCYDEYGQFSGSGFAASYNNGVYKIENLAAGRYYVRTSAYQFYKNKFYNNADTWQSAELVQVANGEAVTGKNFTLTTNTGSISGYVKNKNNEALTDVFINIYKADYSSSGFAQPDLNGFYKVEGLASGNYIVRAEYTGDQNYFASWYDNSSNEEEATFVQVNEPSTTTNINFYLDLGGAVSGTVLKLDNEPPGEYSCVIIIVDENNNYVGEDGVDDNGEYFIKALPAGQYKLRLYYNSQDNYLDVWYGDSYNFESAATVTVTPPDTLKRIDFRLTPGGAITGKIVDNFNQPVPESFLVSAYKEKNDHTAYGHYDGTSYTISRLSPGKYKLNAQPYSYTPKWFNNKNNFDDADPIIVNGPDTTYNINFTLDKGCVIAGSITSKNGQPISAGGVYVYDLENNLIKSQGVYSIYYYIQGIPPGYYKLFYSSNSPEYEDQWFSGKYSYATATIVMAIPEENTQASFSIGYRGSIGGFLFDENNNRINGEEKLIDAMLFDAVTGEYILGKQISFVGGYKLSSYFNNYKLAFVNYYMNSFPYQDSLAVSYYGGGKKFNDPNTDIIPVAYETTQQLNDTKMETAPGSISGSVYLNNDLFTKDAYEILCFDEDGFIVKVILYYVRYGIEGSYNIYGLRPGVYYLLIAALRNGVIRAQWYDAVSFPTDPFLLKPKMIIPVEAKGVVIGNGETSGIDFHFDSFSSTGESYNSVSSFSLEQNYPNPFNNSSVIKYSVGEHSLVTIEVFNMLGERLGTLLREEKSAGNYELNWNAAGLPSGIYFYRMNSGNYTSTKKMILMK